MENSIKRNDLIVFILKNDSSKKRSELILHTDAELRLAVQKLVSEINLKGLKKQRKNNKPF